MSASPVFVVLNGRGATLARRLQSHVEGSVVHGLVSRVDDADVGFTDTLSELRALFAQGAPILAICASGIVIRALAGLLDDKHREPPVLAIAEDGSAVVPLLGGHRGANALARRIAAVLGVAPAITTASDVAFGVALDDPPPGWRIADPVRAKPIAAALLAGESIAITSDCGATPWLDTLPHDPRARHRIVVTTRVAALDGAFALHPPRLALGVGCERDADPPEVIAFVRSALETSGFASAAIACIASIDVKADEPAVHALAAALDAPARFFTASELAAFEHRLTAPSEIVRRAVGVAGVAEAAALAAAGDGGELVLTKQIGPRATLALARAQADIDSMRVGRARGSLAIVGIGPGRADWRTPAASASLAHASDIVGYGLYLDLLGAAIAGKRCHARALGEETERVRLALDLAAEGRDVALVSSGDAGIYALATLVFELIETRGEPRWRRVAIDVVPGVSALQAAAARAGAPLGHDFCAVSLSDLLTPLATIEARLEAAAAADFVIALFNPASQRRREPLARALAILRRHRAPTTPVVVARDLGRDGESVRVVDLAALDPNSIDMMTLLIIGSSATRLAGTYVFTPRGYAEKTG